MKIRGIWCLLLALLIASYGDAKCSTKIASRLNVEPSRTRTPLWSTIAASTTKDINTESAHHQKMNLVTLVVNIIADLCPHGMMPLAYGIAQGGTTGWITAALLLLTFGGMSTYTMISYAELSSVTNVKNIGEIWSVLINERSKWVVDVSILSLCFGCCVFYSAFIGDIFTSLVTAFGVTGIFAQRWVVLSFITLLVLLPLCQLEDLSALKFSSLIGTGGILYTVAFHIWRLLDKTYREGSSMLQYVSPKLQPSWPDPKLLRWRTGPGTLVLINMLCVAFLAHYNSINYLEEFENPTVQRYRVAVSAGFGLSMAVFLTMMMVGYHLFGTSAQPLLLNNFPLTADKLASLARLATGAAITFGYPLMFAGLKSSMYSIMDSFSVPKSAQISPKKPRWNPLAHLQSPQPSVESHTTSSERLSPTLKNRSVLMAVAAITAIAIQCSEEDVSVVLGIVGSVLGCFIAYILPGVLKIALQRQRTQAGLSNSKLDVVVNHALVVMGVVFGGLGVWVTWKTEIDKLKSGGHYH